MAIRGLRGATTVTANTRDEIVAKTKELLDSLILKNHIIQDDVASVIFSVTEDVDATFPALAARDLGWIYTPLFCTREIPVPGSLPRCIRILMHINSEKKQDEMVHIYLYEAKKLRPDLESVGPNKYYVSDK
jgi:chorismate mutase